MYHIHTEENIACGKNGWEDTLPDITQGSEFNNDKDPKKVDTKAEATNEKDHTDMLRMMDIPHNCICIPYTRPTTTRQNKWVPIIPSDMIGFCGTDDL